MKIRFIQPCELELVTGFNEKTETAETANEIFRIGETVEIEVIETNDAFQTATVQFGDGSMAYGVPQMIFEVID